MTGTSAAGIIVIMAVVLVGALAMILWIFVAGSRGSFRHRRVDTGREMSARETSAAAFTWGTRAA